jgi:hypothetical protein
LDMTISAHRNFRLRKRVACFAQAIGPTVAIRKIGLKTAYLQRLA